MIEEKADIDVKKWLGYNPEFCTDSKITMQEIRLEACVAVMKIRINRNREWEEKRRYEREGCESEVDKEVRARIEEISVTEEFNSWM